MLAAKAGSKSYCEAFQFLMTCIGDDIQDVNKNPIFQALKVGDEASPAVMVICISISSVSG